jgi:hypothetical protein
MSMSASERESVLELVRVIGCTLQEISTRFLAFQSTYSSCQTEEYLRDRFERHKMHNSATALASKRAW